MTDVHLLDELMGRLQANGDLPVDEASKTSNDIIEHWDCDVTIKRLLQWHWFADDVEVGFALLSVDNVVEIEQGAKNLSLGYLQVGHCPNGDRVYLKTSDHSVWYWSHDEATNWERLQTESLHKVYLSLASLLISVYNESFIPCDSYSGREYFLLMGGSK